MSCTNVCRLRTEGKEKQGFISFNAASVVSCFGVIIHIVVISVMTGFRGR
jgi:ABC-type lipoprotein release transport system permease subunit